MTTLRAENLTFGYPNQIRILDNVILSVRTGEFALILGENGSGKSTLLRLLAGLLSPTSGRIFIEGSSADRIEGKIGIVFQNPDHQMIADSIEGEIALGMELRGVDRTTMCAKTEQLLERFSLGAIRKSRPESLSGGQKQRVAIAALLAMEPEFMLLDEPDSLLDSPSRSELMRGIEEIRSECGIIWTTANPVRLPTATKYLFLENGKLEECTRHRLMSLAVDVAA